jgi:hypothetical protein
VYLGVASLVSAPGFVLWEVPRGTSVDGLADFLGAVLAFFMALFLYGGAGCVPGLAVWLSILARLPSDLSSRNRRLIAVVSAPMVGSFWLVLFLVENAPGLAIVFGLLWPIGAGFVVRLRAPLVAAPVTD